MTLQAIPVSVSGAAETAALVAAGIAIAIPNPATNVRIATTG